MITAKLIAIKNVIFPPKNSREVAITFSVYESSIISAIPFYSQNLDFRNSYIRAGSRAPSSPPSFFTLEVLLENAANNLSPARLKAV